MWGPEPFSPDDDVTLEKNVFCSGEDLKDLQNTVEAEITTFKTWFNINKLSLNENETKLMVFRGARKKI